MLLWDKENVVSAERNKLVIDRIYTAMERGDRSVFAASVQPDCIWRSPTSRNACPAITKAVLATHWGSGSR